MRLINVINTATFAALAAVAVIGTAAHERPSGQVGDLVCVDAAGRLTSGEDWKECHRPRNLWQVAVQGF